MDDYDPAYLRGQVFGGQLVLSIVLSKLCSAMSKPNEFLDEIQKSLMPRLKDADLVFVQGKHRADFDRGAIGAVGEIAEGARGLFLNPEKRLDA